MFSDKVYRAPKLKACEPLLSVNNVGARTAIAQAGYDLTNGAGSFAAANAATQAAVLGTINPINYENNTATTFGVKLGISF